VPRRAARVDCPLDGPNAHRAATLRQQPLHYDRIAGGRSLVEHPRFATPIIGQPPPGRPDLVPGCDRLP